MRLLLLGLISLFPGSLVAQNTSPADTLLRERIRLIDGTYIEFYPQDFRLDTATFNYEWLHLYETRIGAPPYPYFLRDNADTLSNPYENPYKDFPQEIPAIPLDSLPNLPNNQWIRNKTIKR